MRPSTCGRGALLRRSPSCCVLRPDTGFGLGVNSLLDSSQAQAENRAIPKSRDRAEPPAPRVPPPIPRPLLLLYHHHRPLFLNLAPAGLAVLADFCFFLLGGALGIFGFPPPPAACSARLADVALRISQQHPAPSTIMEARPRRTPTTTSTRLVDRRRPLASSGSERRAHTHTHTRRRGTE